METRPWTSQEVPWSPGPAGGSAVRSPSSWPTVASTRWRPCAIPRTAPISPTDQRSDHRGPSGRHRPRTYDLPDDLRVMVNNAGVDSDYLPVEHGNLDDWRTLFETNVLGVVGVITAAIPILRANRPAVICNISSSSILASRSVLLGLPGHQGGRLGPGGQPPGGAGPVGHPGGGDPPRPRRHRHVPAEHRRAGGHPVRPLPARWPTRPPRSAGRPPTRWSRHRPMPPP